MPTLLKKTHTPHYLLSHLVKFSNPYSKNKFLFTFLCSDIKNINFKIRLLCLHEEWR